MVIQHVIPPWDTKALAAAKPYLALQNCSCDRHLTRDEVVEDGRKTHAALPQEPFPASHLREGYC